MTLSGKYAMRIKSLQLKPFAGLIDKKIEFSAGLNVILGPNEAGKSTLLNALQSALFTEVSLTKSKYDKLIKAYMPTQGGDTIRVYLNFQVHGKEYWLEKSWKSGGKGGSCLFRFKDKSEYTGDREVAKLINQFLPAQEGTIRNILLTWQSALDRTRDIFDSGGGEVRSDLGNILRSSIMETDGISVDRLKEKLDREYEEYFQHWETEREEPENGRGINNPYKREIGKILEAYYEKENVKKSYVDANEIEKEIDDLNRTIQEKEEEQERIKQELKKYEPVKSQLLARQQIEGDMTRIKHETEKIVEINEQWMIQGNWLSRTANSEIKKLAEKRKKLAQEREDTRQYLENKEFRKRFEKLQGLYEKLKEANNKLSRIAPITREAIESLRKKKQKIEEIENTLMASKLKFSFRSKIPQKFSIRDTTGKEEEHSLEKNNLFEKTFQGKLFLEHRDWNLEVQAGEGEIDTLIRQKEEKNEEFADELKRMGVESLEQAQSVNTEYEKHKNEVIFTERAFQEQLGKEKYEDIKKRVKNLGEEKQFRSLEEISSEITNIERDLRDIEEKKEEVERKIGQWQEKYGTTKELFLKIGENQYQLKELEKKIENLPLLPDEFEDYQSFFEYIETVKGKERTYLDDIYELRIKKGDKENQKPELSSEELNNMVSDKEQKFKRICLEGKSIALIKNKANELLEEMGRDTYGEYQNLFKKYFLNMSGNAFSEIEMEDDYPKKLIKPNGSELSYDLLSFGTKDTFSLALRLTLAEYFLQDKEGFLVLDDPLVDMDLDRQAMAAEQINEFAKTKQVIFLTCHTHTAELLKGKSTVNL